MKLTSRMIKRIIKEEMAKANRQKRLAESASKSPKKITKAYLNRIIREEYSAFKKRQRLAEARRRR